jgi:hypothetical protein
MSHIGQLHSSAETCDFAVSSNSCCCEFCNKINDGGLFKNCTFSGKWVLQWTMPKIKILNGVNDAPFFLDLIPLFFP